ncbi:MAG: LLM class F420-dependent oxidoreductase [Actinomycetota bacterium]|jgi:probable F420-dependent oxidoreductase|nr:LLM class F420-dependent oxidoreductase [Acidimicrobiaceae bacterium]MEE2646016.1 LLM class F420-dependent oxidoreductase [Actinomycetota bacterium]|tara:strand:+ start:7907 stop:8776 length:870 start_codon:yes stop_codon:yes gene_type:complete
MKVGIAFANIMNFGTPEGSIQFAQAAEKAGFESLWTVEHVIYPSNYDSKYPYDPSGQMAMAPDTDLTDPLIWLTWLAANTSTIRLGTGIIILPERNPLVLAKQVGTLDSFSGGRVELGIGVGWLKEEFEALGIPWERRGPRTDEYVAVMRELWSGNEVSFDGEFVSFDKVSSNPKPLNGSVPITIGGHSDAAAKRAGRIGDGFFPGKGDLNHMMSLVRESAEKHGRDASQIEVTWGSNELMGSDPVAAAEEMKEKGVSRLIVPSIMFLNNTEEQLAEFGERVLSKIADI